MVPYWGISDAPDRVSIMTAFFFLALLAGYLAFILYFSCFKASDLVIKSRSEIEEENLERCEFLHESLAFQAAYKDKQTEEQQKRTKEILAELRSLKESKIERAARINVKQFENLRAAN